MTIAQAFLPEFDAEMATTRRLLERIPGDRLDWKPHPKSMSLGALATHVTELPRFAIRFEQDVWQAGSDKAPPMKAAADFLARFDANTAASRAAIERTTDDAMQRDFTVLRPNGEVFLKMKRKTVVRRLLLNHHIHHRGQLTVYLRQNEVPLPSIYGPTADEPV
jgi:uncharacterized damage-inducible protein DinB